MATEDHDFEEINYFNFKVKIYSVGTKSTEPVGRLSTEGLAAFLKYMHTRIRFSINANTLKII
jgi:hypothetical protein